MEKIAQSITEAGLVESFGFDGENLVVDRRQDLTIIAEHTKRLRDDDEVWNKGVKNSMVPVLHVPNGVVHELLKIGVNVYTCPMKDLVWGLRKIDRYEVCSLTRKQIA